jgi:coiled-coil domain-containing protein 55
MDGDSSSDDDDNGGRGLAPPGSARSRVNAELKREQDALALRRRNTDNCGTRSGGENAADGGGEVDEKAGASAGLLYDYDGAYDAFRSARPDDPRSSSSRRGAPAADNPRASRYMSGLLQAASERQRERELRTERKIAQELEAEDAESEAKEGTEGGASLFASKDKFVTSAYRRRLKERELWEQERDEKERKEIESDVTRRGNATLAMANFYSNLNRNVTMGAAGEPSAIKRIPGSVGAAVDKNDGDRSGGIVDGFERPVGSGPAGSEGRGDLAQLRVRMRQVRERKVEQARARYFERHPDRRQEPPSAAVAAGASHPVASR